MRIVNTATHQHTLTFSEVYRTYFDRVATLTRALGIPASEMEDIAQEVFLVVERRLGEFDGPSPAGWLYQTTVRTASDHRRRAWFRRLLRRAPEGALDDLPTTDADPSQVYERNKARRTLRALVEQLSEPQRVVFCSRSKDTRAASSRRCSA